MANNFLGLDFLVTLINNALSNPAGVQGVIYGNKDTIQQQDISKSQVAQRLPTAQEDVEAGRVPFYYNNTGDQSSGQGAMPSQNTGTITIGGVQYPKSQNFIDNTHFSEIASKMAAEYPKSPNFIANTQFSPINQTPEQSKLARHRYLASLDSLDEREKEEARQAVSELRKKFFFENFMQLKPTQEQLKKRALADSLELKYNKPVAFVSGIAGSIPFFNSVTNNNIDNIHNIDPSTKDTIINPFSIAKKANPEAYRAGNIAGELAQLATLGKVVKGATGAIKGFSKLAPWVQNAINTNITLDLFDTLDIVSEDGTTGDVLNSMILNGLFSFGGSYLGKAGEKVLLKKIAQHSQSLRNKIAEKGYVGTSKYIDELLSYLNSIDEQLNLNRVNTMLPTAADTMQKHQKFLDSLKGMPNFAKPGYLPRAGEIARPRILPKASDVVDLLGMPEPGVSWDYPVMMQLPKASEVVNYSSVLENEQFIKAFLEGVDHGSSVGYNGNAIDGIDIIDGKVGGKIPVDEFKNIRAYSVKNPEKDIITLGTYTPTIENDIEDWTRPGPDSYIARAGTDSSYFDLGAEWGAVQDKYDLSDDEMFEYFNKLAVKEAILNGKTLRFSHDPRLREKGFLLDEWEYIKDMLKITDSNLVYEGGFWYVK